MLCQMIRKLSATPPFCVPNYHRIFEDTSVPIEAAHLYDAVTLWAHAATAATNHGLSLTDGATLMKLLRPTTYRSIQGFDVNMDSAGDAEGNFSVIGVVEDPNSPSGWSAQPVAAFRITNSSDTLPEFVGGSQIAWIGGKPPRAEPACGFDGKCTLPHDPVVLSAAAAVAAALILAAALFVRHCRYEQILDSVLWRIEAKELTFITTCNKDSITQEVEKKRAHTTIASYRGNIVAVKRLKKKNIDVTRAVKKELKQRYRQDTFRPSGCIDTEDALMMEKRMLWRAPELLREPNPPPRGSQKGDVYSFGIILYEILGRNGPWGDTNLTNAEIIGRVRQPIGGVLFRPPLGGLAARPSVLAVLKACWSERPDRRPDVRLVRLRLKDMHAGMKTNIFDNMLAMMEKYASNLEGLVAARTEELLLEKKRTDDLLNRMLPRLEQNNGQDKYR
nr:guanylate cyclase 32E-like [Danaus plexippus plexippus]